MLLAVNPLTFCKLIENSAPIPGVFLVRTYNLVELHTSGTPSAVTNEHAPHKQRGEC